MSAIVTLLNSEDSEVDRKEMYPEPVLPSPEPLLGQFAGRTVYSHGETVDERLTSAYWLSTPSEEGETEIAESVSLDISFLEIRSIKMFSCRRRATCSKCADKTYRKT